MPIPDDQALMLPVLAIAADGETRVPQAAEALADRLGLPLANSANPGAAASKQIRDQYEFAEEGAYLACSNVKHSRTLKQCPKADFVFSGALSPKLGVEADLPSEQIPGSA